MWACIFAPFFSLSRCYSFSYRIEADRILCHRPWSCVSVIFECNNSWRSFFLGSIVALYAVHFILFPILFCCMHSRLHKYRSIMNIETRLELIFTERILLGDLRFSISFNYSISQSVCVCAVGRETESSFIVQMIEPNCSVRFPRFWLLWRGKMALHKIRYFCFHFMSLTLISAFNSIFRNTTRNDTTITLLSIQFSVASVQHIALWEQKWIEYAIKTEWTQMSEMNEEKEFIRLEFHCRPHFKCST